MKLTNKTAIYKSPTGSCDVTIICEPQFSLKDSTFLVPIKLEHGICKTVNLDDLQIVDRKIKPPEFVPDWNIVTLDYLAMDKNGEWYSFNSPDIHYLDGAWHFNVKKDTNQAFREEAIQYKCNTAFSAFYVRPPARDPS